MWLITTRSTWKIKNTKFKIGPPRLSISVALVFFLPHLMLSFLQRFPGGPTCSWTDKCIPGQLSHRPTQNSKLLSNILRFFCDFLCCCYLIVSLLSVNFAKNSAVFVVSKGWVCLSKQEGEIFFITNIKIIDFFLWPVVWLLKYLCSGINSLKII